MKIKIKEQDGFSLNLWVPLFLIKSKFVLRLLKKHSTTFSGFVDLLPYFYKELKKYKKQHKSFELVSINYNNGDQISIIL